MINQLDAKIPKWFAIYTRPKAEKKVNEQLVRTGIETYLPLKKELRQWKDRKKWIELPLFTSYIFVRVISKEYYEITRVIHGFVKFVTIGGSKIAVRDVEIETIKKLLKHSANNIEVSNETFKLNQEGEIKMGFAAGSRSYRRTASGRRPTPRPSPSPRALSPGTPHGLAPPSPRPGPGPGPGRRHR